MKTNKIALSGVLLGLNLILLFGATMLPGIELSLFAMSSFMTAIVLVKVSPRQAAVFYFASVLLAGLLLPNKLGLLPYIFFFGYYGIIKFYIEKIIDRRFKGKKAQLVEGVCKSGVFLAAFTSGILLFKEAFTAGLSLPELPLGIIGIAAVAVFLVYDYAYTLLIGQMNRILK